MKKLNFEFNRDWIVENRQKYGNPIRQMEKFIKSINLKLVKSDFVSITVEFEDDNCEIEIDNIIGFVKQKFEMENPWVDITITGDTNNLKEFIEKRKESGFVAKVQTEKPEEKKAEIEPEEKKEEKKEEVVVEERKEPEKLVEEKPVEPEKKAEETPEEKKTEVEPEEKKESTNTLIQYSPVMVKYLKELNQVIPMLCKMDAEQCVWSQNLLVSIDEGFGYSEFLKEIAQVFSVYRLADENEKNEWVKEMVITQRTSAEQKYADWEQAVSYARSLDKANEQSQKRVVLSLDITEWQTELQTEKVRKYLCELNNYTSKVLCVFKLPYMELAVLQRIGEVLSDIMTIKLLTIPAVSIDNMVLYIKNRLQDLNCSLDDNCDSYLEQLILREKSDDSFLGYKTLEKLSRELIYKKAIINCEKNSCEKRITENDLKMMLEDDDTTEDPYEVLNKLIGISQIRQQIEEIVVQIKTHKELEEEGASVDRPCIHMMFTGNPGTGKTTVARLLARILKNEGVLRKGLLFEVQGRSLCGRYVGETAPRTSAICRDAYGSVLFIDEAYSLARADNDRDYGKEAVQTLIAEMENHRDDFCVILAGYKKPMYELLEVNPGLKSRIPYEIEFHNYSREELAEIFFALLEGKFKYEESLKEVVQKFFSSIPDEVLSSEEFSNARMVRNLFERVWGKAAYRRSMNGGDTITIQEEDFKYASEMAEFKGLMEEKGKKRIGFSCE